MDSEKIRVGLWSAVGGAIVAMLIGFNYGGWMTTGTAEARAKESVAAAIAERLGTICVAQLNQDAARGQKLSQMTSKDPWEMGRFFEKQNWVIMPGEEKPESGVAESCAKQFATKR
ncbi:MAG: hypothetical protein ACREP3_04045 [Candidatus Binatia bacterium]